MTILQKARESRDELAGAGWPKFGHADQAVRHTDAWEQENFQEEQARWEEAVAQTKAVVRNRQRRFSPTSWDRLRRTKRALRE